MARFSRGPVTCRIADGETRAGRAEITWPEEYDLGEWYVDTRATVDEASRVGDKVAVFFTTPENITYGGLAYITDADGSEVPEQHQYPFSIRLVGSGQLIRYDGVQPPVVAG